MIYLVGIPEYTGLVFVLILTMHGVTQYKIKTVTVDVYTVLNSVKFKLLLKCCHCSSAFIVQI